MDSFSINKNKQDLILENEKLKEKLKFWENSFNEYYTSFHKLNYKYKHLINVCKRILEHQDNEFDKIFIDNLLKNRN